MVLHDVAERARAVVKIAATLDTEVFRHRDLHAFDELPIPQRLEKRIGKAEKEQVLHRVFAQVVVDAKNVCFPEDAVHHPVQCLRCGKIMSERFLDHDARALGATRFAEPMNDGLEQAGRDGEIVQSAASRCPVSAVTPEKSPHRNSRRQCSP